MYMCARRPALALPPGARWDRPGDAWAPGVAHSLWAPYHATSAKWALPYVAPTGAHDAYQADEYMRWTNGGLYLCKQDNTVWSPAGELPEAWELAEAAIEPPSCIRLCWLPGAANNTHFGKKHTIRGLQHGCKNL